MNKQLVQLLKVVEKHNPHWYPYIYGYLNKKLDSLELDQGHNLELGEQYLDISNGEFCVVAEPFGFKNKYNHDKLSDCLMCGRYAIRLFDNSGIYRPDDDFPDDEIRTPTLSEQRKEFVHVLTEFYKHRGFMK